MDFSGLDFAAGRFTQTSTYLVTDNVLPKTSLQLAMARLIEAWPAVTLRVNMLRYRAYKSETPSMLDDMLKVRILDSSVAPHLEQEESDHGIAFRDCQTLAKLFEGNRVSWTDYLCPRVALVEAALFQDGSVVKFTTQHVACDAIGLYNVAAAFCEGLLGDVETRGICEGGRYRLKKTEKPQRDCKQQKPTAGKKLSRAGTPGVGYFAWIRVLLRSWAASWQSPSRWRAMYIPGSIIDDWREAARSAGVSVSPFNLVAAWVHMGLADEAAANSLGGRERMIISVSLRKYFECPPEKSDLWNPTAGIAMSPFAQTPESLQHQRLVRQALSIRGQLHASKTPELAARLLGFLNSVKRSPVSMWRGGCADPPTLLLNSWSHAPFQDLPLHCDAQDQQQSPVAHVQHELRYARWIPTPWTLPRSVSICREGAEGGYWLEANLSDAMWERLASSAVTAASGE